MDRVAQQWARERPQMPVESIGIVGRILQIAKLVTDERRRLLHAMGIDAATFDLLATLRRTGPPYRLSPADLARQCLLSGGAVTQRVARAEAAGFVGTIRSATGQRTVLVALTDTGHDLVNHSIEAIIGRERDLIAHLSVAERDQLAGLLRLLLSGLATGDDSPGRAAPREAGHRAAKAHSTSSGADRRTAPE
jgi:DNA-binding MarR family transcriptional regulator